MDLKAKVIPKYWKQLKEGVKDTEYRQLENLILVNTETGEEFTRSIGHVEECNYDESFVVLNLTIDEVPWVENRSIYKITLEDIKPKKK